ncbi:FAD binding domain protein, partial [Metarhizium majus ARSEF 297]
MASQVRRRRRAHRRQARHQNNLQRPGRRPAVPDARDLFDSLGFAHRAWRESNHLLEMCLWNPDEHGRIRRSGRIPDTIPGICRRRRTGPGRPLFRSNLDRDDTDRLLTAAKAGGTEKVGLELEGDSTDYIWGVLDMVPITDFPDIRMRCAIHSAGAGSIMVIPRENKLVRLYIQLTTTERVGDEPARADRSKLSPRVILEAARRIVAAIHPLLPQAGLVDGVSDRPAGRHLLFRPRPRVPGWRCGAYTQAGQGMNVGMQRFVVKGQAHRCILKTYESERRQIAQDLSSHSTTSFQDSFRDGRQGTSWTRRAPACKEFKTAFEKGHMFAASGIAVDYGSSVVVAKDDESHIPATRRVVSDQSAAPHVPVGRRIPSVKVLNQADARPWHLH